jgi:hypothetical protein
MPMDDPYSLDPSKVRPAGGSKKSRVHGLGAVLGTVAVAGLLGLLVVKLGPVLLHAGPAQAQGIAGASTSETAVERELVTFADQFLMNYYNYSYTLYPEAVRRAEAMMTPEMQAVYSQHALDRQFIGLLQDKQVSTDGFRITPNSYLFRNEGKTHYFQLSGTMTYTTGVNDAQAEWPTTVLLEIVDTDQGFRVNNVQRLR